MGHFHLDFHWHIYEALKITASVRCINFHLSLAIYHGYHLLLVTRLMPTIIFVKSDYSVSIASILSG